MGIENSKIATRILGKHAKHLARGTWPRIVLEGTLVFLLMYGLLNIGYIFVYVRYEAAAIGNAALSSIGVAPSASDGTPTLAANELVIPSLDVRAPVVEARSAAEDDLQAATHEGVVHYPDTAEVGTVGNAFIFGHSSDMLWVDNPYRHVFSLLPEIHVDDLVYVSNAEGTVFTYKVTRTYIVSPDNTEPLSQKTDGRTVLTLQTSYPFGTALARFIAQAELVP